MKTNIIFCYNTKCRRQKMHGLIIKNPIRNNKTKIIDIVVINKEKYVFLIDVNSHPERLYGFIIDSYKVCPNYKLNDRIMQYLQTHSR